jgi:uncharacterized protein (TIGR02145 family)
MNINNQSLAGILLLAMAFALAACGDDDSSFAPRDDESSSSIEEEASSSSVTLSGASAESNGSSSSSAQSSSSAEPALSSAEGGEDLSSSSSAKSSSSVASSSSAKSSSSFLRKDYTSANHSYSELEDPRDHRVYKYLTIRGENRNGEQDSITVMAENLNVGIMVQGAEDQTDETKIEKYCYDNDTLNCYQYGGLYQWAEAMQLPSECNAKSCADQIKPNHRGICPEGWRLLTYDDFYIVVHADGNRHGVEDVRAMGFGGYNYSGYSLIGGGMRITPSGGFKEKDEVAYWFYPGENEYENYSCGDDGYSGKTSTSLKTNVSYKQNGLSIRCVKLD